MSEGGRKINAGARAKKQQLFEARSEENVPCAHSALHRTRRFTCVTLKCHCGGEACRPVAQWGWEAIHSQRVTLTDLIQAGGSGRQALTELQKPRNRFPCLMSRCARRTHVPPSRALDGYAVICPMRCLLLDRELFDC